MTEGWFKLHRSALSESDEFWKERRARTRWEAWVDLIGMAAHTDHEVLYDGKVILIRRGQVPTSERNLMYRWQFGSRGKVRRFLTMLENMGRIEWSTSLSRTGQKTDQQTDHPLTILTICNYERYQATTNPGGTKNETEDGTEDGLRTDQTEEGISREKNLAVEIERKKKRYPPDDMMVVNEAFDDFRSTRKTGRMSVSIILSELNYWERFPVEQVIAGLRTYLTKAYATEGKAEKYARGIIRGTGTGTNQGRHPYRRLR